MANGKGDAWLRKVFKAKAVRRGGIVRRQVSSVEKFDRDKGLKAAVKKRGFHMVKTGGQYLIFCHSGDFKMIC